MAKAKDAEAEETSEYTRLEQAHYDEIRLLEKDVRRLEYAEELAKRQHKLAKQELDTAQIEMRDTIHRGPDPQHSLPGMEHDRMDRSDEPRWRTIPLTVAIHDGALLKALEESGISTVGNMADFTNSSKKLTSIKGIGEMGEAKIIEQMQMFWDENPGLKP